MEQQIIKNKLFSINRQQADPIAEERFCAICGFDRDPERFWARLQDGLAVREKLFEKINVQAVVSSFGREAIQGDTVCFDDISLSCSALWDIDSKNVEGVFAYMLTAGNIELQDDSMLETFYADTWGTAYVDAGRDILKGTLLGLAENSDACGRQLFISDSFGPGFYGMDVREIKNFFTLLNSGKIGVTMTESGMMLPQKSCAGFFVVVDEKAQLPGVDCSVCLNNRTGCRFCKIRNKWKGARLHE